MADTGLSVAIKGSSVLIIRHGQRSGMTRAADLADELSVEAAEALAADMMKAIEEIRRRKTSD